jgi:hypothetical protein
MLLASPAGEHEPSRNEAAVDSRPVADPGTEQKPSDPELPGHRSFRLGFTPDGLLSRPDISKPVYEALSRHADLVAFHLGLGVPWEEALREQPFPPTVEPDLAKWSRLKGRLRGDQAVDLALTPLRLQRNGIAA